MKKRPQPHETESDGYWKSTWTRLSHNRLALGGLFVLVAVALLVLAGPLFSPYAYSGQNLELGAAEPSAAHWLGTDRLGRDVLTRLLHGGRISLLIGICATLVSLLIGVTYGAIAGYLGGRADSAMMRFVDILYAIPFTVFVIVLMVAFGRNFLLLFVAIGAVEWLTMSRIVRGQVLTWKSQLFVQAGRALGFSRGRLISRHILPNVLGPVIVYTTLTVPQVMLLESFLSFLGLGVQPPMSSWGLMIRDGAQAMESYPWLMISPGIALSLTLFSLNALGDGLRDALDPRFVPGANSR